MRLATLHQAPPATTAKPLHGDEVEEREPIGSMELIHSLPRFLVELIIEMRLHRRPFAGDDAEHDGVAQCAVGRDLMVTHDAVLLGAQPLDGAPALMIEEMCKESDNDAIERFERMLQRQ